MPEAVRGGHIVNVNDLAPEPYSPAFAPPAHAAERYAARTARISALLGARKLGYNVTVLPPGKKAYPFHNHHVNEEMFFVLDGAGEVRIGNSTFPIRAGDVISCPPGGPELAHQIANTGAVDLRYLAVSTNMSPDIAEYPDSQKIGVLESRAPQPPFVYLGRSSSDVHYWDGE